MNRLTDSFASDTDTLLSDSTKEDMTEISTLEDPHCTANEPEDSVRDPSKQSSEKVPEIASHGDGQKDDNKNAEAGQSSQEPDLESGLAKPTTKSNDVLPGDETVVAPQDNNTATDSVHLEDETMRKDPATVQKETSEQKPPNSADVGNGGSGGGDSNNNNEDKPPAALCPAVRPKTTKTHQKSAAEHAPPNGNMVANGGKSVATTKQDSRELLQTNGAEKAPASNGTTKHEVVVIEAFAALEDDKKSPKSLKSKWRRPSCGRTEIAFSAACIIVGGLIGCFAGEWHKLFPDICRNST